MLDQQSNVELKVPLMLQLGVPLYLKAQGRPTEYLQSG